VSWVEEVVGAHPTQSGRLVHQNPIMSQPCFGTMPIACTFKSQLAGGPGGPPGSSVAREAACPQP